MRLVYLVECPRRDRIAEEGKTYGYLVPVDFHGAGAHGSKVFWPIKTSVGRDPASSERWCKAGRAPGGCGRGFGAGQAEADIGWVIEDQLTASLRIIRRGLILLFLSPFAGKGKDRGIWTRLACELDDCDGTQQRSSGCFGKGFGFGRLVGSSFAGSSHWEIILQILFVSKDG